MRFFARKSGAFWLAAAFLVAGCGSDERKILDTERIERAIEDTVWEKRRLRADVSCPSGTEQKKGVRFTCNAVYRGGQNPFVVVQDDDRGAVHYEGIAPGQAPSAP